MKSKEWYDVSDKYLQREMIFIHGLPLEWLNETRLRSHSGLGQFGRIKKLVINFDKQGVFVTFENDFQAAIAILATDLVKTKGGVIRSSIGLARKCPREVQGRTCFMEFCNFFHQNGTRGKFPEKVKKLKEAQHIDVLGYVVRHQNLQRFLDSKVVGNTNQIF